MAFLARDRIRDLVALPLGPDRQEWATRTRFEDILLLQILRWDVVRRRVDFLDLEADRRATSLNLDQWAQ